MIMDQHTFSFFLQASLENLLETLSFQQSLLDSRRRANGTDRRRTVSEGCLKYKGKSHDLQTFGKITVNIDCEFVFNCLSTACLCLS